MLTTKTLVGAGWSIMTRLSGRAIDFVTLLVLARILAPADFGLVALAMTVVAIVETVLEIPLVQALTRLPAINRSHLDTAFTLGLIRGLVFGLVVVAIAWPFAAIYKDARLAPLIAILSLGPVFRGLYSPAMVNFMRAISFREVFLTQVAGKILAAASAMTIVLTGGGHWALAANYVVTSVASTILSYFLAPYRPALSLKRFSDFSGFMGWFSMSQFVSAINWQFDRVLLGNFISRDMLGKYTMSSDLASLPTQSLIGPAMQPVMAAFSRINDDMARMSRALLKAARFVMMLAVPACAFIALSADLLVAILLDSKWADAAPLLQALALTILPNAYFQPLYSAALAIDRPVTLFQINLIDLALRAVLVPLGLIYYSMWGVIAAKGAIALVMFFVSCVFVRRLFGISVWGQIVNLWPVGLASVTMIAAVAATRYGIAGLNFPVFGELAIACAVAGVAYLATLFACGVRISQLVKFG